MRIEMVVVYLKRWHDGKSRKEEGREREGGGG